MGVGVTRGLLLRDGGRRTESAMDVSRRRADGTTVFPEACFRYIVDSKART
jgi:hypothetical protein